ncbi:MAG: hypothetical protein FJ206_05020 [Gemmatimonadetes bacterium]|nr:hypothetical protein [Gemmatimonadota bacterium]
MGQARSTRLSAAAAAALFATACASTETGPLEPPEGLVVTLRDSARLGELTWFEVRRPIGDTGSMTVESSDPAILAVEPGGRVFPLRTGEVDLTARAGALSGSTRIRIAAPPDSFGIALRFRWSPTDAERAIFSRAAMRWRRMLRHQAPWSVDLPAGACVPGTSSERIQHQGVVIVVDRFDDGSVAPGVTGTAGPCVVDETGRTLVGAMALRRSFSDLAATLTASERQTWENQFARQIGQALGLAGHVMTGIPRPELDRTVPGSPRWRGPAALAAYRAMGGFESGVPITADLTSWRADLGTEGDAMLAVITSERRISAISVGALADRGYLAEPGRAEPPPDPDPAPAASLGTEARRGPVWIVDAAGRARKLR